MIFDPKIAVLLLGSATTLFVVTHQRTLRKIPFYHWVLLSFFILYLGWSRPLWEVFFRPGFAEAMGRALHAGSSLMLAFWCWRFRQSRPER
ncbi:MAG: hypothetical protein KKB20_22205 [Proteobacteria bacterium]|nr:hypothetical protein [Pseudomonadota bacterium]